MTGITITTLIVCVVMGICLIIQLHNLNETKKRERILQSEKEDAIHARLIAESRLRRICRIAQRERAEDADNPRALRAVRKELPIDGK